MNHHPKRNHVPLCLDIVFAGNEFLIDLMILIQVWVFTHKEQTNIRQQDWKWRITNLGNEVLMFDWFNSNEMSPIDEMWNQIIRAQPIPDVETSILFMTRRSRSVTFSTFFSKSKSSN